jgi:hypothetical protein
MGTKTITKFTMGHRFFAMIEIGNVLSDFKDFKINSKTSLDEVIAYLLFNDTHQARKIRTYLDPKPTPTIRGFIIGTEIPEFTHLEKHFLYTLDIEIENPIEIEEEKLDSINALYCRKSFKDYRKALSKASFMLAIMDQFIRTTDFNLETSADLFSEYQDKESGMTVQEREKIVEGIKNL